MSLKQREGEDLMNVMCGELLGSGQFRHVYRARFDDKIVIKYEHQNKERNNIFEHDIWMAYKDDEFGKWFAPCLMISPDGTWLAQVYCETIPTDQLPKQVPAFFCDLKPENWGLYQGRVVCRDYGFSNIYKMALRAGKKLKDVDWRRNGQQYVDNWRVSK